MTDGLFPLLNCAFRFSRQSTSLLNTKERRMVMQERLKTAAARVAIDCHWDDAMTPKVGRSSPAARY